MVAKKWERILKWERTATVLYVFKSELVDFEGTFGGYLYNYSFVRHVQMVASVCWRNHPTSLEVTESMLWLDHAFTVKIQKNITICWDIAHMRRTSSCIDTPRRCLRSQLIPIWKHTKRWPSVPISKHVPISLATLLNLNNVFLLTN